MILISMKENVSCSVSDEIAIGATNPCRNDLDDQLYGQFAKCKEFLRQEPIHAESRENLKSLLAGRQANGIIFTTMQKFEESHEALV